MFPLLRRDCRIPPRAVQGYTKRVQCIGSLWPECGSLDGWNLNMTIPRIVGLCFAGLIVISSACWAQSGPASATAPAVNRGIVPGEYKDQPLVWIPKLADIEKLTGRADALQWKDAAVLTLRDPATRGYPKYETQARLFCSDKALYVAIRAVEPKLDTLITKGAFWERDEVEVFLEPFRDTIKRPYHHLCIDAAGNTLFNRYHVYPRYFQEHALAERWEPKIEVVAGKDADAWSLEMRIPLDQLKFDPGVREAGTLWRLNLCRIRPSRGGDDAMLWSWSDLAGKSFQQAARLGYALIEPMAPKALIESVRKDNAPASDPSAARAASAEVQSRVDQLIADLGAADRGEPQKKLGVQITALAKEGPAMYGMIEGKFATASAKAKRDRLPSYGALRDFAYALDQARPEDDPIPDSVVKKIADFEARQQKDAQGMTLSYRLAKPLNYDPSKKYPMLIWLHGSAEKGDDNLRQLYSGVWEFYRDELRAKYPCFIFAPQCPPAGGWADMKSNPDSQAALQKTSNYRLAEKPSDTTRLLFEAIAAAQKEFPAIDADRLYISGSSMGGFGTYELITRKPEMFAAAMPVCGGGDETKAASIAKLPIWIFHGEKDEAVKVAASRVMFQALKDAGGSPKYTEVPGAPHALGAPYMEDEVLQWLFAQKR